MRKLSVERERGVVINEKDDLAEIRGISPRIITNIAVIAERTRGGKSENRNSIRIPIYTVAEKFPYI